MDSTQKYKHGFWSLEEDRALMVLVNTQGPVNWIAVSHQLQHRSPKQCRERWNQNLNPRLNHEPVSVAEGELIEQLVAELGKRWAEISRRLGNRSENVVKNWWNGTINKRKRTSTRYCGIQKVKDQLRSVANTKALSLASGHSKFNHLSKQNCLPNPCAGNERSIQSFLLTDQSFLTPELSLESYVNRNLITFSGRGYTDTRRGMLNGNDRSVHPFQPLSSTSTPALSVSLTGSKPYSSLKSENLSSLPYLSGPPDMFSTVSVSSHISSSKPRRFISPPAPVSLSRTEPTKSIDAHAYRETCRQSCNWTQHVPQGQQANGIHQVLSNASSPFSSTTDANKQYMPTMKSRFASDSNRVTSRGQSFQDSRMNVASLVQ